MAPPAADRSALLNQIHKGTKLKKAVTNDRSAPMVAGNSNSSGTSGGGGRNINPGLAANNNNHNSRADDSTIKSTGNAAPNGPMGFGGLFAGGMPKLRSTGSRLVSSSSDNKDDNNISSSNSNAGSGLGRRERSAGDIGQRRPEANTTTTIAPSVVRPAPSTITIPSKSATTTKAVEKTHRPAPTPPVNATSSNKISPSQQIGFPARNNEVGNPSAITNNRQATATSSSSGERRSTAPSVPATRPPPLPNRPAGLMEKMRDFSVSETTETNDIHHRKPSINTSQAINHNQAFSKNNQTSNSSTGSMEVRWQFPPESTIPKPKPHSGRNFVYPSGRDKGTFINNTTEGNRATGNTVEPVVTRETTRRVDNKPAQSKTTSIINVIKQKQERLEAELESAIVRQDFEVCLELKPRITKLKDMAELAERGLAIDQAKVDSV